MPILLYTNIIIICRGPVWARRQILWRQSWLGSGLWALGSVWGVCPENVPLSAIYYYLLSFELTETDNCRLISLFIRVIAAARYTGYITYFVYYFYYFLWRRNDQQ